MSAYNTRDPYEQNNAPYNRLNDYYRSPNTSASKYNDNYYSNQNTGYSNNYYGQNTGYSNNYNNYSNSYKQPSQTSKPLNAGQTPKTQKVRSVLLNPDVRQQLTNKKKYTPYFIYTITGLQILVFIVSIVLNFIKTGKPITDIRDNFFVGPASGVLITLGARYIPCMKKGEFDHECPYGIKGTMSPIDIPFSELESAKDPKEGYTATLLKGPYICTPHDVCGFFSSKDSKPNQWFRFITPLFIHSGLLHIVFNMIFQVHTGISLEKDFGWWRIGAIYMASGIFGFIFEAKSLGNVPTVGCSGALYGLLACILLDLIQNWKLVIHPVRDLIKLLAIIFVSLGIGFLPYFDNFAHIGGFIMGILTGLIFLPSVIFSETDGKIKKISMIVAIVLSIGLTIWAIKDFYSDEVGCEWCQHLNCAPFIDKCKR